MLRAMQVLVRICDVNRIGDLPLPVNLQERVAQGQAVV